MHAFSLMEQYETSGMDWKEKEKDYNKLPYSFCILLSISEI